MFAELNGASDQTGLQCDPQTPSQNKTVPSTVEWQRRLAPSAEGCCGGGFFTPFLTPQSLVTKMNGQHKRQEQDPRAPRLRRTLRSGAEPRRELAVPAALGAQVAPRAPGQAVAPVPAEKPVLAGLVPKPRYHARGRLTDAAARGRKTRGRSFPRPSYRSAQGPSRPRGQLTAQTPGG